MPQKLKQLWRHEPLLDSIYINYRIRIINLHCSSDRSGLDHSDALSSTWMLPETWIIWSFYRSSSPTVSKQLDWPDVILTNQNMYTRKGPQFNLWLNTLFESVYENTIKHCHLHLIQRLFDIPRHLSANFFSIQQIHNTVCSTVIATLCYFKQRFSHPSQQQFRYLFKVSRYTENNVLSLSERE